MAVTLLSVEYASITVGNIEMPIIVATMEGSADSTGEWFTMINEHLYPMITDAVCTVSIITNVVPGAFIIPLNEYPAGSETIGSSNGFQFTRNVTTWTEEGITRVRGVNVTDWLTYKGTPVGRFMCYTGHGSPEILPWVIYVDSENHPYEWTSSNNSGPYIMGINNEDPGVAANNDNMPVSIIPPGRSLYQETSIVRTIAPKTTVDMTDDLHNRQPIAQPEDPYEEGGYSGPGGGGGTFDFEGVPDPFTGDMSGVMTGFETGFFTVYSPTIAELQNLAQYLWSNNFDLDTFKKLFNNPMDLFLTLNMLPVQVASGAQKEVGFGLISSGVYMTTAGERYHTETFGPLEVLEPWHGYLSYSPYIKAELYLPYIGTVPIDIDDIMNKYINVVYVVDVLSGACVAGINKWERKYGAVMPAQAYCIGRHSGNAATQLPISGSDYSTLLTGIFSAVSGAVAGAVASGGAGAIAGGLAAASSAVVNDSKPQIAKGGTAAGVHGWLSTQHPSLIMSLPIQCIPSNQRKEIGYPIYDTSLISQEDGFIKMAEVHLKGVRATDAELSEIESLLKSGVYV